MSAKRERKVIPLETAGSDNVIEFPKPKRKQQEWRVVVESDPEPEDFDERLLLIYQMFGYTGCTVTPASAEGAANTDDTLIRTTETGGGRTA